MKALMICTEKLPVPPIRGGAVQTYIDAVTEDLALRHDLTILGVRDPDLPDREIRRNATYVRIPGGSLDLYAQGIARFLSTEQFDIIHLFNRPRLVKTVRLAAPRARIVLSLHNDMFEPHKIDPAEAEEVIRQVDTLVTISDYVGQRVATLYPSAIPKLRTIYSAVDLDRFQPRWSEEARRVRQQMRAELGLGNGPVILYVGRLSPKKGVDVLLRAMPEVVKEHPGTSLVLVGSKWYGADQVTDYVAYVRALAARCPAKVVSSGFVTPDEVHRWFWLGDVFVCASQWEEPLARVHYEAMAAGLPIVTTARGGNPEVVAGYGNGIVVEECDDPSAFARALSQLLSDPVRRDLMGQHGRSLVEERFSWRRVIADILSVWERLDGGAYVKVWEERTVRDVPTDDEIAPPVDPVPPDRHKVWERNLERLRARAKQIQKEQEEERKRKRELSKAKKKAASKEKKTKKATPKTRDRKRTDSTGPSYGSTTRRRRRRNQSRRRRLLGR